MQGDERGNAGKAIGEMAAVVKREPPRSHLSTSTSSVQQFHTMNKTRLDSYLDIPILQSI